MRFSAKHLNHEIKNLCKIRNLIINIERFTKLGIKLSVTFHFHVRLKFKTGLYSPRGCKETCDLVPKACIIRMFHHCHHLNCVVTYKIKSMFPLFIHGKRNKHILKKVFNRTHLNYLSKLRSVFFNLYT